MPNILIFESDLSFANELQAEFIRRSCDVSIVDDASVGLQQASNTPPDLILLCTELPRMNGFSVCNRLKRDPELRKIPVIIMSANASEENFQQHKNLTNKRADDYVHKPISVPDMMLRVDKLLNLNGNDAEDLPDLELKDVEDLDADELIVDEVVDDLMAAQVVPAPNERPRNSRPSELELSEFADSAFDALLAPLKVEEPSPDSTTVNQVVQPPANANTRTAVTSAPPAHANAISPSFPPAPAVPSSIAPSSMSSGGVRPSSPPSGSLAPSHVVSGSVPPTTIPPPSVPPPPSDSRFGDEGTRQAFVSAQSELANAKERIADLEDELVRSREKEQTIEKLYAELDDAKARLASGGGGRAKDILDLREALNQKDKDLLALRDDLSAKDKQLLATKDTALDLERKTANAEDRAVELEKRVASLERSENAAQQDREQAAKRADTYKRKQEKLTEELTGLRTELDDLEANRQALNGQLGVTRQAQEQAEVANRELTERVNQLSGELNETRSTRDGLQSKLQNTEETLRQTTSARDGLQSKLQSSEDTLRLTASARDGLQAKLQSTEDALQQTVTARDEFADRSTRAESRINALESEARSRGQELDEVKKKLSATEQQLDESQLQAAEQGEQLDKYRVVAGELGGLLTDALTKLREIQPK
jgi:DNA-binding response OmpR family regulator/predicted  nucleic acid-binding Zn-ribbon protein